MKKILIVDDDLVMRNLVSELLTKHGYEVATAENGVEGLSKFGKFKPDVIISDVLMPEMDGYDFCTQIRKMPKGRQTPLLMLTSLDSIEQKIKGFEVGADDYIVKPFEPLEFMARVASLIKRSEIAEMASVEKETGGKVIAVFSLRGGSGVSSIATNIAVGLAQMWEQPTTLVDLVFTGGQSALFLNLALKNTWADITQFSDDEIDDFLIQSALLSHESGVFVLASPNRPEFAEAITPETVSRVISNLRDFSEYVVLDFPHDFSATTLAALDMADVKLVILQPEVASIRSADMVIETFQVLEYDMDKVYLILNTTMPGKGISQSDIEKYLSKAISLTLPFTPDEMLTGLNTGAPPIYTDPTKPLSMLFEDLALALSKDEHRTNKPENPSNAWKRAAKRFRKRKLQDM